MNKKIMPLWLFYFLSFTWGIIMSFIGCITSSFLIMCGCKVIKNQYSWAVVVGRHWGGLELGLCSIVCEDYNRHLLNHEYGHALQNCYFGPFMIFITLASAIRYWYREYLKTIKKVPFSEVPWYDSIWFEGTASYLGDYYYKIWSEKNENSKAH